MNRTEIEATRDAIARHPFNFNMRHVGKRNAIVHEDDCGTVGCIAGYTLARHGQLEKMDEPANYWGLEDEAQAILDLSLIHI